MRRLPMAHWPLDHDTGRRCIFRCRHDELGAPAPAPAAPSRSAAAVAPRP
jgi:hypothetical protein